MEVLRGAKADAICLQEVTPRFVESLEAVAAAASGAHSWLSEYAVSGAEPVRSNGYGTLMLVRREHMPVFSRRRLPSDMGRDLLMAAVTLPGGVSATVATVHLESLNAPSARAEQLRVCAAALVPPARAVLCGDFNFCSRWNFSEMRRSGEEGASGAGRPRGAVAAAALSVSPAGGSSRRLENGVLAEALPGFADAWSHVHGTGCDAAASGFTFDTTRNGMFLRSHGYEQMRYDRVMAGPGWVPVRAELLGTDPLLDVPAVAAGAADAHGAAAAAAAQLEPLNVFATPPRSWPRPVFCSDHFGLHVVLELR